MEINKEIFEQQRRPRFGNSNPEKMQLAFWKWMIRGDGLPSKQPELIMREGKLKSSYGPYRPRDLFNVPPNLEDGPIWTFDRMGATRTGTPDGRLVCIGGEHEDFYDPDFCIYNDVVVFDASGEFEIFGYPNEVFPPTDFHTASLVEGTIIITGGLGYLNERQPGHTPVYMLDLENYRISRIETHGEMPGWIYRHQAEYTNKHFVIRGGEIFDKHQSQQSYRKNFEDYALDLKTRKWQRLTNRNWLQFSICQEEGGILRLNRIKDVNKIIPPSLSQFVVPSEKWDCIKFLIEDVPIVFTVGLLSIEIVVEGSLPWERSYAVMEKVRLATESAVKGRCTLQKLSPT